MLTPRVRGLRGVALGLLAMAVLGADAPSPGTSPSTPTPSPSPGGEPEQLTDVAATCAVEVGRTAQVVACDVEGLPPGQQARLTVETVPVGNPPRSTWTGSARAGATGFAVPEAALPCEADGVVPVRVAVDARGRYEHRQQVALQGRCRPVWLPTVTEAVRLVAILLVLGTLPAVVRAWRRARDEAREEARARRGRTRRTRVSSARGRPR